MPLNKENSHYPLVLDCSVRVLAHRWRMIFVLVVYKGVAWLLASAINLKVFITWDITLTFLPNLCTEKAACHFK